MTISFQSLGSRLGHHEYFNHYIQALELDRTRQLIGPILDNKEGRVCAVFAQLVILKQVAPQSSVRLSILGGLQSEDIFLNPLKNASGQDLSTSALDISSPLQKPIVGFIESESSGRYHFPPFLAVSLQFDGRDSAWEGHVSVCIVRN